MAADLGGAGLAPPRTSYAPAEGREGPPAGAVQAAALAELGAACRQLYGTLPDFAGDAVAQLLQGLGMGMHDGLPKPSGDVLVARERDRKRKLEIELALQRKLEKKRKQLGRWREYLHEQEATLLTAHAEVEAARQMEQGLLQDIRDLREQCEISDDEMVEVKEAASDLEADNAPGMAQPVQPVQRAREMSVATERFDGGDEVQTVRAPAPVQQPRRQEEYTTYRPHRAARRQERASRPFGQAGQAGAGEARRPPRLPTPPPPPPEHAPGVVSTAAELGPAAPMALMQQAPVELHNRWAIPGYLDDSGGSDDDRDRSPRRRGRDDDDAIPARASGPARESGDKAERRALRSPGQRRRRQQELEKHVKEAAHLEAAHGGEVEQRAAARKAACDAATQEASRLARGAGDTPVLDDQLAREGGLPGWPRQGRR